MIYPSCSEMVFRLDGDVKEVKKAVLTMLDCVETSWKGDNYLDKEAKTTLAKKRKEVKKVKKMNQFNNIVFPFTTNKPTLKR